MVIRLSFVAALAALLSVAHSHAGERIDQYPVESFLVVDHQDFNEAIAAAAEAGDAWVANPVLIVMRYLNEPNYRFMSVLREDNAAEGPTESVVTVVLDGYLDDSQRGSWYRISLSKPGSDHPSWVISEIREARLCARLDAPKAFVKGPCP